MHRSYLFVPGDAPGMLETMDVYDADAVIIDLEDSVAPNHKDEARALLVAFLSARTFTKPAVYVRINAVDESTWFEADLKALASVCIDGVVLPKATEQSLNIYAKKFNANDVPDTIALLETPDVFFQLPAVTAFSFVKGLMLGGEDLRQAIEAGRTAQADELFTARSLIVFAAAAQGLTPIDTPFTDVHAPNDLDADAKRAAQLGMHAKACIHPNQVHCVNTVFTPEKAEVETSQRIIARHEKTGSMRFSLDGKMVDKPIIERARRIVARAARHRGGTL